MSYHPHPSGPLRVAFSAIADQRAHGVERLSHLIEIGVAGLLPVDLD